MPGRILTEREREYWDRLPTNISSADLSRDRLLWYTNWYLREDTLRAANTAIVNFQSHQSISQYWGGGTLSSSEGQ